MVGPGDEVLLVDAGWLSFEPMVRLAVAEPVAVALHESNGFAREVADEIVFMDHGKVVERATSQDFFANPQTDRAAEFLMRILRHG